VGRVATANIRDKNGLAHGIADASGYYARLGGGLGVRPSRVFEIDANVSWELFALGPNGPDTSDLEQAIQGLKRGGLNEVWAMGEDLGGMGYGTLLTFSVTTRLRF